MKKRIGYAACALGVLLLFAGCQGPAGPQGAEGERGLNVWEGPFRFSLDGGKDSEPVTDVGEFSSALKAALEALPEDKGADPDDPVKLKVSGLTLSETEQLYVLWGAITRYVDLDLSGCKGVSMIGISSQVLTENKEKIASVALPESVEFLENKGLGGTFENFIGLESAAMPGVKNVGARAFYGCSTLADLDISGINAIGNEAFSGCSALANLDFSGVTSIGNSAFLNCVNLTSLTLPGVASLGTSVFDGCIGLTTADLSGVESIGIQAFKGCSGLGELNIPRLKSIGTEAFRDCAGLTTLDAPTLETIGVSAFYQCVGLTALNLPGLRSFGNQAFRLCNQLEEITLGPTPPALEGYAFSSDTPSITFKVPSGTQAVYEV